MVLAILALGATSLVISWLLTAVMIRVAPRVGFVDKPGHRKIHSNPKPLGGGVAIFWAFLAWPEGTEFDGHPIESLLGGLLDTVPDDKQAAVRNNGGGHANHSLFWQIMKPGGGGEPTGDLAAAINDLWGDTDALKTAMNDGGVKRFGSGWTWLVWDGTGLSLYSTPNQDSPLMQDDVPLLGIDVWEHAYYLNYQNRRPDYLSAWWNVVNWDEVGKRFDEARAK